MDYNCSYYIDVEIGGKRVGSFKTRVTGNESYSKVGISFETSK